MNILYKQYLKLTSEERIEFINKTISPFMFKEKILEAQSVDSLSCLIQSIDSLLEQNQDEVYQISLLRLKNETNIIKKRLEDNVSIDYKALLENLIFPCSISRDETGFFIFEYPSYLDEVMREILKDKIYRDDIVDYWGRDGASVLLKKPPFGGCEIEMALQINKDIMPYQSELLLKMKDSVSEYIQDLLKTEGVMTKKEEIDKLAELKSQGKALQGKIDDLMKSGEPMSEVGFSSLIKETNSFVHLTYSYHLFNYKIGGVEDILSDDEESTTKKDGILAEDTISDTTDNHRNTQALSQKNHSMFFDRPVATIASTQVNINGLSAEDDLKSSSDNKHHKRQKTSGL